MTGRLKHIPTRFPPRSVAASSKVTTGRRMFVEGGEGRSLWADGVAILSEGQISICRRASAMECELEAMEARMSEGQKIDLDQYGRLTSRLCRLLELVGIRH